MGRESQKLVTSTEQASSFTFFLFLFFGLLFNCLLVTAAVTQAGISNGTNASSQYKSDNYFFHTEWFYTEKLRRIPVWAAKFLQMAFFAGRRVLISF